MPQQRDRPSDMRYFAKDKWLKRYLALRVIHKADAPTPSLLKKAVSYLIQFMALAVFYWFGAPR